MKHPFSKVKVQFFRTVIFKVALSFQDLQITAFGSCGAALDHKEKVRYIDANVTALRITTKLQPKQAAPYCPLPRLAKNSASGRGIPPSYSIMAARSSNSSS